MEAWNIRDRDSDGNRVKKNKVKSSSKKLVGCITNVSDGSGKGDLMCGSVALTLQSQTTVCSSPSRGGTTFRTLQNFFGFLQRHRP